MKSSRMLAATVAILSARMAFALPVVGDIVGTNANDATAALEKAGCKLEGFEAEAGNGWGTVRIVNQPCAVGLPLATSKAT